MTFIWPIMLLSLLLLPPAVGLYLRQQQRRQRLALTYGSLGFVQASGGRPLGRRRHIPPALFFGGLAILLTALARPQTVVSLVRQEGTVILAFDVSGSMAADDLAPTRMDAAKAAARDFVLRQPRSVRIGVVAFSDNGFSIQTPTDDQAAVLAAIGRLAPQRGTSLGQGILASLSTLEAIQQPPARLYSNLTPEPPATPTPMPPGTFQPAAIVMLTDGENNESPDPLAAAQAAVERGVRIYTVGIGSAAGTTLHVNGFTVFTQLDEALLQQVAQLTSGAYYSADSTQELQSIYEHLNPQLVIRPEKTEVTSLLAGAGIVILLIGGSLSLLWFGRVP